MYTFKTHQILKAATLALAFALAPVAHAQTDMLSRDTGVGKQIAAQGNLALQQIKADIKAAARALKPRLPAAPRTRVVKMSQPAGATLASGAAVRCAE